MSATAEEKAGIWFCNPGFVIINDVHPAIGDTIQALWVANGSARFNLIYDPRGANLNLMEVNSSSGSYFFEVRSDGLYLTYAPGKYIITGTADVEYNLNLTNTGTHDEAIYSNMTVIHPAGEQNAFSLKSLAFSLVALVAAAEAVLLVFAYRALRKKQDD